MGRAIKREDNSFIKALLKLIPSEIIAVFIFLQGVLPDRLVPHLVISLLLVGITPLYLYTAMGVRSRGQLAVSTLSMAVWIYALGQGPVRFLEAPLYEPWYGSVILAMWTLIPPMLLYRKQRQPEQPTGAYRQPARPRLYGALHRRAHVYGAGSGRDRRGRGHFSRGAL